MLLEAIIHEPFGAYAHPLDTQRLKVRLRAKRGDLQSVQVVHGDRYASYENGGFQQLSLEKVASTDLYDFFEGIIPTKTRRIRYWFYLSDGSQGKWYGECGFANSLQTCTPFQYAYITEGDVFRIPDWVKEGIVYQIFPERFANGDPDNDPSQVEAWGEKPKWNHFFGGDLKGIIEKLEYLEELGANILYLTPIFTSPSNHKYDTSDYYQIDPHFGDLTILKELVDKAHRRGMRVILDAVFNHCGYEFFAFQDVVKNGKKSKYWNWFFIQDEPVVTKPHPNYETFANDVWTMPKLNTVHPEVKQYLIDVARYWILEADIDGWRLDVANEIDPTFWRDFRKAVKEVKPDALIIGEVWHNANPWLQGDQFDSVMNYPFREACLQFFAKQKIGVEEFHSQLMLTQMSYKEQALWGMFNLLGSHDTERIFTACEQKEERLRLAYLFQMTYLGMPMIYYGDEIGMEGETDPDCRRTFIWDKSQHNQNILEWTKRLIRIRKSLPALQAGSFRLWHLDPLGNIYGFIRGIEMNQPVGVLLNNSPLHQRIRVPVNWSDQERLIETLSGTQYAIKEGMLEIELSSYQGAIFTASND